MSRDAGYDRYLTIFSPDGRLYQIEYAKKAVEGGGITSVAVRGNDTVCFVAPRKVPDKLIDPASLTRMFNITPKIGCVMTGLVADGKSLVGQARQEATNFEYNNGYPIPVAFLAKRVADIAQVNTQHAGRRTMGADMILSAIDDEAGSQLFHIDPAGHYFGYRATAAGTKAQEAISIMEKRVTDDMDLEKTITTAIMTLQTTMSADFKPEEIEVGVVHADKSFRVLSDSEVEEYQLQSLSEIKTLNPEKPSLNTGFDDMNARPDKAATMFRRAGARLFGTTSTPLKDVDHVKYPVLIAGSGPVGMFTSILLSKFGIQSVIVEASSAGGDMGTSQSGSIVHAHPRAHVLHTRSMELLRDVGLEEKIWAQVPPSEDWRKFRYCPSLLEDDLATMDHFRTPEFKTLCTASPSRVAQLSQPRLETTLAELLQQTGHKLGSKQLFNCSLENIELDPSGSSVWATVKNGMTGETLQIESDYVVAADGARSKVRRDVLRIGMEGEHDMETFASLHFTSKKLGHVLAKRREGAMLSFVFNSKVIGVVVSHDMRRGEWVIHVPFFPPVQTIDTLIDNEENCIQTIKDCVFGDQDAGDELDDLEFHSVRAWGMNAICAKSFSGMQDRVFLTGDSAHLFPPSGGFGVNAGLADAHNIAWKLAHVHHGWADSSLLRTYDQERRPVIQDAVSVAIDNYRRGLMPAKAMGLDRAMISTALSLFSSDLVGGNTEGGKLLRNSMISGMLGLGKQHLRFPKIFKERVRDVVDKRLALPLLFPLTDKGYRYESDKIDSEGHSEPNKDPFWLRPRQSRDEQSTLEVGTVPGKIVPHAWVQARGVPKRISTLDIVSQNSPKYTLFVSDPQWRTFLEAHPKADQFQVTTIVPESSPDSSNNTFTYSTSSNWERDRQVSSRGAVLVRPDGHVAWRDVDGQALDSNSFNPKAFT
eukprot:CAMPEP_0203805594 /NCGR_PEP_ID=MMETSP0100_2-20121128/14329_1 /ASSEMBLY_ACC=CAM_ASM_000210 /TAXON_ID=96639 /ORGANISM=" , Strain NY0313808BC1" /LENGTH=930 /DNA_ID=CAMNT_0050714145 /DNA_START=116 /DNA_END=2910 /DNA_ORIENTATION=+